MADAPLSAHSALRLEDSFRTGSPSRFHVMPGVAAMIRNALSIQLLFLACNANAQEPAAAPRLLSFEALGCSGDWSTASTKPTVWRLTTDRGVSFLVRHSATCELRGGAPRVSWNGHVPDLDYAMTPLADDVVVMCE
jgi:hypothetical protein